MMQRARVAVVGLAALATSLTGAATATATAPNWEASAIASHAMLYLDAPPAFREAMFREAAASGATSIRVDVPIPAIVKDQNGTRSGLSSTTSPGSRASTGSRWSG